MATLDEILGGSPPNGDGYAPKGSAEWAEQNSGSNAGKGNSNAPKGTSEWAEQHTGENAPTSSPVHATPTPTSPSGKTSAGNNTSKSNGGGGYEALFRQLNPYTPPTDEELEKERKKQKRDQIFAAIGDGISALSNLFFTTQYAPNMYTGKNTMSERTKIRYDKLMKDREKNNSDYFYGLMKARQADDAAADKERAWQRQIGLDQEARDRYNEGVQHRNEREKIADDRYNDEQEYKKGRDKAADDRWNKNFNEEKRRADRNYNFGVKQHNDNVSVRREQARATTARGVRGKQLGFSDGEGNQVSIYENVWKGSMQQVYDVLRADMEAAYKRDKANNPRVPRHNSASEKEDFVKQNWHKSPKASQIMLTLSSIDPATMTSELNNNGLGWGNSNNNETDW